MLTRSSLFCVLNTIYYSVSQLVGQMCWVCSPKVGRETVLSGWRIIYSQRNDINKKRNSKCFSDARLLLKGSVPIQYLRSDEMLTGLMSVALFYCYFRNLLWNKSLTSEKNELFCQKLYCAGGARSLALARTRHRAVTRGVRYWKKNDISIFWGFFR